MAQEVHATKVIELCNYVEYYSDNEGHHKMDGSGSNENEKQHFPIIAEETFGGY